MGDDKRAVKLGTEAKRGWTRAAFFSEPEFLASDKCPGS
jgi:hypothetical protein